MDKNDNVVVAVFEDRAAAEAAIDRIKKWDKSADDIKLGAIGLLYKEGDKVKSSINHQGGRGLKVGAVVGVIAGVLTGGVGLIGGAAAGGLMGGALGSFFAKSLNLNEAECNALGMELELGKAAVVVTLDEYEIVSTRNHLEHAGGVAKVYIVPSDAVDEAAGALSDKDVIEARIANEALDDAMTRTADSIGGYM
jgi:hypothetical protein